MTTGRRGFIGALAAMSPAMEKLLADVPEVESVSKITPKAGSVIVMTCADYPSVDARDRIGEAWGKAFTGAGLPVPLLLVLDHGMTLQQVNVSELPPFASLVPSHFAREVPSEEQQAQIVDAVKRHLDNGHGPLAESIRQAAR